MQQQLHLQKLLLSQLWLQPLLLLLQLLLLPQLHKQLALLLLLQLHHLLQLMGLVHPMLVSHRLPQFWVHPR
jgi:hypothetical protein